MTTANALTFMQVCVCMCGVACKCIRRLCFERLTGQTGCPGLDLRGKRTGKRQHQTDLHHKDKDAWIGDLEIMIHKENEWKIIREGINEQRFKRKYVLLLYLRRIN